MARFGFCLVAIVMLFVERVENKLSTKPCRVSDPDFNTCLITTAQKLVSLVNDGDPDLKLNGFEPYQIDDIKNIDQPTLKFYLTNNMVYGSKTVKILDLKLDTKAQKIYLEYSSTGHMISDYVADGRVLVVPVTGDGKSTISLIDTIFKYHLDYKTVKGKDGKDHWKVTKYQIDASPGKIKFRFTNLFNGNKQLGDFFDTFANNNWQDIFTELGPPILKKLTDRCAKEMKRFLAAVPVEDLVTF